MFFRSIRTVLILQPIVIGIHIDQGEDHEEKFRVFTKRCACVDGAYRNDPALGSLRRRKHGFGSDRSAEPNQRPFHQYTGSANIHTGLDLRAKNDGPGRSREFHDGVG